MNEITTIVISAIVGGIVTYIFGRVNERRKDKKEVNKSLVEQRKNRPEFSIIEMIDYFDKPGEAITTKTSNLEVYSVKIDDVYFEGDDFFVKLDKRIMNQEDLVCREYKMKNIGKTAVYEVDLISNSHKNICLLGKNDITFELIKHGMLNYHVLYDRRVGPGEIFTLKLIFHKDLILSGIFTASYSIGMRDDNGNYWIQPFFAPDDKLYETRLCSYKEYKKKFNIDIALDCFKNPHLW